MHTHRYTKKDAMQGMYSIYSLTFRVSRLIINADSELVDMGLPTKW